mmetsp:Transcript_87338/g.138608  ORF Transcript_87338/g.138608 Transcript_87338/m.138608 type:complete len:345 (+) Transcript_87338:670-1704(+)
MFVLRDLGHVRIQILCPHLGCDLAGTELDVAVLDAMAISVRHKASKGIWISHHLSCLIASCCHRGSGLQRSSGSRRNRTSTVDIANGFAQVIPVIIMCLLRTQEGAKVWETTSRSCTGNDEGLVPLRIRVQRSDTTRPRNLSADITIVDTHGNAAVNHQLTLREHVGTSNIDDTSGTFHQVDHRVWIIVGHLQHRSVLPLCARELPVTQISYSRRCSTSEGKSEGLRVPLEGHALQVLHHQVAGVARYAVENEIVLVTIPCAAPIIVLAHRKVFIVHFLCLLVILILLQPSIGRSQWRELAHELIGEIQRLEGRRHFLTCVIWRHGTERIRKAVFFRFGTYTSP